MKQIKFFMGSSLDIEKKVNEFLATGVEMVDFSFSRTEGISGLYAVVVYVPNE